MGSGSVSDNIILMAKTYDIIRMFEDERAPIVIRKNVVLGVAQDHCNDPETSSKTAKDPKKVARCAWFDGYREHIPGNY